MVEHHTPSNDEPKGRVERELPITDPGQLTPGMVIGELRAIATSIELRAVNDHQFTDLMVDVEILHLRQIADWLEIQRGKKS